jgi:hypothetical protein
MKELNREVLTDFTAEELEERLEMAEAAAEGSCSSLDCIQYTENPKETTAA